MSSPLMSLHWCLVTDVLSPTDTFSGNGIEKNLIFPITAGQVGFAN